MFKKYFKKYRFYLSIFALSFVLAAIGLVTMQQETSDGISTVEPVPYTQSALDASALPRDFSAEVPPENAGENKQNTEIAAASDNEDIQSEVQKFIFPVGCEVLTEFSGDKLIYSETMADWRAHQAIDFAAQENEMVLAVSGGTVEDVYNDPLYGTTVVISHSNGFKSIYSSLANEQTPAVGAEVLSGDMIGIAAKTAVSESLLGIHIHFALMHDGEYVNPLDFLE